LLVLFSTGRYSVLLFALFSTGRYSVLLLVFLFLRIIRAASSQTIFFSLLCLVLVGTVNDFDLV
jgi:hypothetical protein